ncbi:hypothetical protein UlMin_006041 [Ulmus minor]
MPNKHHNQNQIPNALNPSQVEVVMVPFPAQGHLNQLLHLSRLISAYNLPIHFIGNATHNKQAKLRVHGWSLNSISNIIFHDFIIPPLPTPPPPNPNADTKFPSHIQPVLSVPIHYRQPLLALVQKLSSKSKRVVVIYDSIAASAIQDVGSLSNVECHAFQSISAFSVLMYYWDKLGKPFEEEGKKVMPRNIPSFQGCFPKEFKEYLLAQISINAKFNKGSLLNTTNVLEKPFIDLLDKIFKRKNWAVGPFNPVELKKKDHQISNARHFCLEWLDKQEPNSVIFVSFGTTTTFTDEEIKEMALGLEQSEQKFIWVARDADKADVSNGEVRKIELPKGYEERVKSRGLVVRDWAPQLEILAHSSTGGFLSHCGWNSCMESITMGVPIAAWPMHSDQPTNAVLITELLKVGTFVREWERRNEMTTAAAVENGVKRLMASEEGHEIRKRAEEMGAAVRQTMDDVGNLELDSFIAHITR